MADWQDVTRRYGYVSINEAIADMSHVLDATAPGVRQRYALHCAHAALKDETLNPQAPISLISVMVGKMPENALGGGLWCISIVREAMF